MGLGSGLASVGLGVALVAHGTAKLQVYVGRKWTSGVFGTKAPKPRPCANTFGLLAFQASPRRLPRVKGSEFALGSWVTDSCTLLDQRGES